MVHNLNNSKLHLSNRVNSRNMLVSIISIINNRGSLCNNMLCMGIRLLLNITNNIPKWHNYQAKEYKAKKRRKPIKEKKADINAHAENHINPTQPYTLT